MRIAIFADGTWNKMDAMDKGTNVVKLCEATVNEETKGQTTFYDPGVGTRWYNRIRGGVFGAGISENITQCYKAILKRWKGHEDEIFLFGFSRGAYTVRSLGGLINFVGLVRDPSAVDEAYDFYREAKKLDPKDRTKFDPNLKAKFDGFCQKNVGDRRARIKLIGVWDTVGSLGIPQSWLNQHLNPFPHEFHSTSLGDKVDNAVHAVSIDEKRKAFEPTLWDSKDPRVTQVFFTGVHSDVGGGYNDTDEDRKLGDITLRWMAKYAEKHGLQINWSKIPTLDEAWFCGRQHESWTAAWRVVRRYDRPIADGASISGSVRKRLDELTRRFDPHPYVPVRLTKPFERFKWDSWPGES